jgi:hypothetical protein
VSSTSPDRGPDAADEDFTEIDLAELDEPRPLPQPPRSANGAAPEQSETDRRLAAAQATAAQLRDYADGLATLDEAELGAHVEYYQHAHSELQRALSDIDNG